MGSIIEIILLVFALIFHKKIVDSMNEAQAIEEPHENTIQRQTVKIMTENINGVYYAWKNGVEFIGQSESPRDLARILVTKYPDTDLIINERQ